MTRQVDVKALISHIVKGDGADKCRICMGDTSEGQVFLGDTVMMDGTRPISLAELLESITGVEVLPETERPSGICSQCIHATLEAANFRELCRDSENQWQQTVDNLMKLPVKQELPGVTALKVIMTTNDMFVVDDSETKNKKPVQISDKLPQEVKGNFTCKDCGRQFVYAKHFSKHLMQSDVHRACDLCGVVLNKDSILEHLLNYHKIEPIKCKKCAAVFLKQKAYMQHKALFHSPGSFSCGYCGRTFRSGYAMNAHNGVHAVKTCPSCDKTFRNQTCYMYHIKQCCNLANITGTHRTKHKVLFEVKNRISEKKIKVGLRGSSDHECICDYCGKKYKGKRYVAAHIQTVHMTTTHRPCPHCGKLMAAAHMSQHIKSHRESASFTCHHCGMRLQSKLGFTQHLRIHTGEKPYKCSYCDEHFSGASKRATHVRKCHTNPEKVAKHKCTSCSAAFMLPYLLKKHVETAHGQKLSRDIVCEVCDQNFSSVRGLVHHRKKHQDQIVCDTSKLMIMEQ